MTDFLSGLVIAFALVGLGFIIGAVWVWRNEPPDDGGFDDNVPDFPPADWTVTPQNRP